jgi:hypothetical protein
MNLSDERIIEFLSKSPLKSFGAMLDVLRYLDGNWIWKDLEYELFDNALDDGQDGEKIRVPTMRGIAANALLAFTRHAFDFHMIRRRPRTIRSESHPEIIVFYELMPAGKHMIKILEQSRQSNRRLRHGPRRRSSPAVRSP